MQDEFWERQLQLRDEQTAALQAQLEKAMRTGQDALEAHQAQV